MNVNLRFDKGTILLEGFQESSLSKIDFFDWDERVLAYRAPAFKYREIVMFLRERHIKFDDYARKFSEESFFLKKNILPRSFQIEALKAWFKEKNGVVSLPTGSGKTILSVMLIEKIGRPTLIHVPTIDLMRQWKNVLTHYFKIPIGLLGGGINEIQSITVATYDSALIHVEDKGNQFGFLVFDECHHLPSEQFKFTAISSIAPFRLGLSATPERNDGKESFLYELCGPLCYEIHIDQLSGNTLAPYEVRTIDVEMNSGDREKYEIAREIYIDFIRKYHINFKKPGGWQIFLKRTSESIQGREAFKAYLLQKKLSQASVAKEKIIWKLFQKHKGDRILIFTQDNEMAYRIGRNFLLPVITHLTKIKERESFLKAFKSGDYPVLITSKVLNEGVDVPEANVAVIVSGSGSIREHVQRLGRILRARPGKRAVLYELVSQDTGEYFTNQRRRKHRAYEGTSLF
tara:strand:- start:2438 stop:3817 length:1380 start_codon:yes stop_codon:yes gene_type:complete